MITDSGCDVVSEAVLVDWRLIITVVMISGPIFAIIVSIIDHFSHISGVYITIDTNNHFFVSEFYNNCVQIKSFKTPKSHNEDNNVISEGISSHRPFYTIGPESDVLSVTLTSISEPRQVTMGAKLCCQ